MVNFQGREPFERPSVSEEVPEHSLMQNIESDGAFAAHQSIKPLREILRGLAFLKKYLRPLAKLLTPLASEGSFDLTAYVHLRFVSCGLMNFATHQTIKPLR